MSKSKTLGLPAIALLLAAWSCQALAAALEILVPAYFYPAGRGLTYWSQMTNAAARVPLTAILNPDSGPGNEVDPSYTAVVDNLRRAGGRVLGYVPSGYANRPLPDVLGDIERYRSFYVVDGFFIDEMTNDSSPAHYQYYRQIYAFVKAIDPQLRLVGNPGWDTQEPYVGSPTADVVVNFESSPRSYRRFAPSAWVKNYPSSRFAHLVHNCAASNMASFLDLAQSRNAGLIYLTNDSINVDPWDTLPSYWSSLVTEVCRRNGGATC